MPKENVIYVALKPELPDARGEGIVKDIADLGINDVEQASVISVFAIAGGYAKPDLQRIGQDLLADPITQVFGIDELPVTPPAKSWVVSVTFQTGVTDTVGMSAVKAVADLGLAKPEAVRTGKTFILKGGINKEQADWIARKLLYNPIIEDAQISRPAALAKA